MDWNGCHFQEEMSIIIVALIHRAVLNGPPLQSLRDIWRHSLPAHSTTHSLYAHLQGAVIVSSMGIKLLLLKDLFSHSNGAILGSKWQHYDNDDYPATIDKLCPQSI